MDEEARVELLKLIGKTITQRSSTEKMATPECYHGLSCENPIEFIDRVQLHFQLNDTEDEKKLPTLKLLLRGVAKMWLAKLEEKGEIPDDFDDLVTLFKTNFAGQTQQWLTRQLIDNTRLSEKDAAETYIATMLKHADRLALDDRELMQTLIRGLHPELKAFVIAASPANSTDVIDKIKLGEQVMKMKESATIAKTASTISNDNIVKSLKETCDTMMTTIDRKFEALTQQHSVKALSTSQQSQVQCYNCNGTGHYSRNCPVAKSQPDPRVCYNCNRKGHLARQCRAGRFTQQQDQRGPGQPRFSAPRNPNRSFHQQHPFNNQQQSFNQQSFNQQPSHQQQFNQQPYNHQSFGAPFHPNQHQGNN